VRRRAVSVFVLPSGSPKRNIVHVLGFIPGSWQSRVTDNHTSKEQVPILLSTTISGCVFVHKRQVGFDFVLLKAFEKEK